MLCVSASADSSSSIAVEDSALLELRFGFFAGLFSLPLPYSLMISPLLDLFLLVQTPLVLFFLFLVCHFAGVIAAVAAAPADEDAEEEDFLRGRDDTTEVENLQHLSIASLLSPFSALAQQWQL